MQEDEEAVGPSSGAEEAAEMMQEAEEANAEPSLGGSEAADMIENDEEAAAGPSSERAKAAEMMPEDEDDAAQPHCNDHRYDAVGGLSSTDGADRSIQTASLSTKHKAMMKMMLQRMFQNDAGARPELAELVQQFNKSAIKPESAECIQQASFEKSSYDSTWPSCCCRSRVNIMQ